MVLLELVLEIEAHVEYESAPSSAEIQAVLVLVFRVIEFLILYDIFPYFVALLLVLLIPADYVTV